MLNRRRQKRLSDYCNIICVRYRLGLRLYKKDAIKILNLSGGGLQLCLSERLKPGTIVDIDIKLIGNKENIPAKGEVIWSRQTDTKTYTKACFTTGIMFTAIDPLSISKIYTYFQEHNIEIKLT